MAHAPPKTPLVAIIGATGTGKSQLAVELALRFDGEILNADAMQMYKGLPIITNKIPEAERMGVPHHLLDFIGLEEQPWTVAGFVRESQRMIGEIRDRGKLPMVVGGTHYYLQSLLFRESIVADMHARKDGEEGGDGVGRHGSDIGGEEKGQEGDRWSILEGPTEDIYAKLMEVDPDMARRWHPRDRRHVQRSLEIWLNTGRKASEVYKEQQDRKPAQSRIMNGVDLAEDEIEGLHQVAGDLRYDTLVLWVTAQDETLKDRLNTRVDKMIASGLLEEAFSMARLELDMQCRGFPVDKSKGIWVSIGYKELLPYITALHAVNRDDQVLARIRAECFESVKASTRQYAKTQQRWIRHKFMNSLAKAGASDRLFLLDSTNIPQWHIVTEQSQAVVETFLAGQSLPDPRALSEFAAMTLAQMYETAAERSFIAKKCEICDKIMMTQDEWDRHLKSRGHHRVLQSQRKRSLNEGRKLAVPERSDNQINRE